MEPLPRRKPNRLPYYDYTSPGYYFVTICTADRKCLLGQVIPGDPNTPALVQYSSWGRITADTIAEIPDHYSGVDVDHYVVMPNHVHMILVLRDQPGQPPSVSKIIQQFKRAVSMRIGRPIWQLRFHDHVIRNEADYQQIWQYIENNPAKWAMDRYYQEG